jgi:hypothetical protein
MMSDVAQFDVGGVEECEDDAFRIGPRESSGPSSERIDAGQPWTACKPLMGWESRKSDFEEVIEKWSGKRDLNPRPSPWQGDALPLSYSRSQEDSRRGGILLRQAGTVKQSNPRILWNYSVNQSGFERR